MLRPTLVALAIIIGACSSKSPGSVPAEPPGIAGQITAVDRAGEKIGTIRVEAQAGDTSGSPKAVVTVEQGTAVFRADTAGRDFNDLRVGQWVRVWFTGPVMQSYPVQGAAVTIVIDSVGP